jgi:hypothetical protein
METKAEKLIFRSRKIKKLIEKLEHQKKDLEEYLEEFMPKKILSVLGLEVNDELLYKSREYRDDSVSCFSTEQESIVYITGLKLYQGRDRNVIIPLLSIKNKRGKLKPIKGVNLFLPYKLFKDGKLMFENEIEDIIIPNKYSNNEISDIRKKLKEIQKITA